MNKCKTCDRESAALREGICHECCAYFRLAELKGEITRALEAIEADRLQASLALGYIQSLIRE